MNNIMQVFILFILISFSGCSFFIGLPESSWTTSSQVCTLPGIEMINTDDVFNRSSDYVVYKGVEKAWTGTVVKHTRWAAFIGCGRSLSHLNSGISVKTAEDCLRHCSEHVTATHFVIKDSSCYCLSHPHQPKINGDINDCRMQCTNASYTPCSSGRSALVFTFVEDLSTNPTKKYIENECLTTTKDKSKFVVSDCNEDNLYGCNNNSFVTIKLSWYAYQEKCLEDKSFILYQKDTIPKKAPAEKYYWTPIFRTHTVVTGKLTKEDGESCLAVSTVETNNYLTVENCTTRLPFICSEKVKRNAFDNSTPNKSPRFVTLPLAVIVAVSLLVFVLIFVMIIISIKAFRKIRIYQEILKSVNERLPGTEFSNYTGIEDTNEEINDSGYKELSENVLQPSANSHEEMINTSEDTLDYQGYLVPEQHYHTIPDVEVHYAAANVEERNPYKEHFDKDDYLEPII